MVPGLRGLLDSEGGASDAGGRAGGSGANGVRVGDRLLVAAAVLRGDVRVPYHSRARAGGGDGREACEPGS